MTEKAELVRRLWGAYIRAQLNGFPPFQPVVAVRLFSPRRIQEAVAFALGPNMEGRTFRHNCHQDDSVCWEFELLEDAVLFKLKFDGFDGKPINIAEYIS